MDAKLVKLGSQITQAELEEEIDKLNKDHFVDGIIVQVQFYDSYSISDFSSHSIVSMKSTLTALSTKFIRQKTLMA